MKKYLAAPLSFAEYSAYLFFIFLYPLLFVRYGLDYTDGPFHYMAFTGLRYATNFTFFYAALGNLWMRLAGDSVISFRVLALILNSIAQILPVIIISKLHCTWKEKLRYLAVGMIMATTLASNVLNWDSFSRFFLALIFVTVIVYLNRKYWILIVLLSIFTAMISAVRLPSAAVILPVLIVLVFKDLIDKTKATKTILKVMGYLAVVGFVYYLLWLLFNNTGNISLDSFGKKGTYGGNTLSFAYLDLLFSRYLRDSLQILEMMGVISLIYLIWKKSSFVFTWKWIGYTGTLILITIYLYFRILGSSYNWNFSIFYSSVFLFMNAILLYHAILAKEYNLILLYAFTAIIGFVSALGSNTGLLKLATTATIIIPYLLHKAGLTFTKETKVFFYLLISLVIVFSIYSKMVISKTYEDGRFMQLSASVNCDKLKGVKTGYTRKKQIEDILLTIDEFSQKNKQDVPVFFYGTHSYLFSYLTDTNQPYARPFEMKYNSPKQAEALSNYLESRQKKPLVVLLLGYPEGNEAMKDSLITSLLKKQTYDLYKQGDNYRVYSPGKTTGAF